MVWPQVASVSWVQEAEAEEEDAAEDGPATPSEHGDEDDDYEEPDLSLIHI